MRCLSLAVVLLGIIMVCRAAAFLPPFAGGAVNSLTRATASARSGCRQRLAAYSSPYNSENSNPLGSDLQQSTSMSFKSPLDVLKQGIAKAGAGTYDKDVVKNLVDGYTSGSTKVVVFSWTRCPFCKKAKQLMEDLLDDPADYEFLELDERQDGNAIRYELSQITGRTSVPQIWIAGKFVGGCNDGPGVFTLMERRELIPMLEEAGCSVRQD
ncbi:unnamed protein product [Pylaiella littoralis]